MKKNLILCLNAILLCGLVSCSVPQGSSSESTSSASSETSSSLSSESSSESSSSESGSGDEDDEHDYSEDPEPDPSVITVAQAIEIINGLEDNKRTTDKYEITGYITSITEEFVPQYKYLSFAFADSMDSETALLSYRTYAEDEVSAQEFLVGAKFKLTGRLAKAVVDGNIVPEIISPEAEVVESLLVPATAMTLDSTLTLAPNKKTAITVNWAPENARKEAITWSVADPTIASMEGNVVTALSLGETTITATSENFTASLTLTVEEESNEAFISFAKYKASDAPTSALAADKVIDNLVEKGANYLSECTEATKIFLATGCLRLGNSSGTGKVTFALANPLKVSSVTLSVKQYPNDKSNIGFSAEGFTGELEYQGATSYLEFSEITYDLGGATITSFSLFDTYKRAFVENITFTLANN